MNRLVKRVDSPATHCGAYGEIPIHIATQVFIKTANILYDFTFYQRSTELSACATVDAEASAQFETVLYVVGVAELLASRVNQIAISGF